MIAELLRRPAAEPVPVVAGGQELVLDPAAAGLRVDAAATAEQAVSGRLLDQLRSRFGAGRDVDPVVEVDEPALRTAVEALAPAVAREAAEGSVRFDETPAPVAVAPVEGRALDVDGSVEAVARAVAARGRGRAAGRGRGGLDHRAGRAAGGPRGRRAGDRCAGDRSTSRGQRAGRAACRGRPRADRGGRRRRRARAAPRRGGAALGGGAGAGGGRHTRANAGFDLSSGAPGRGPQRDRPDRLAR